MRVEIVSQSGQLWDGEAEMVVVPAETGEVGILQNHVPFLALLVPGEVRVKANDGQQRIFRCGEGFVTVDANEVIVAVEDASEVAA